MAIKGTQVPMYTTHIVFVFFNFFYFYIKKKKKKKPELKGKQTKKN